jgi:hypothetical protein
VNFEEGLLAYAVGGATVTGAGVVGIVKNKTGETIDRFVALGMDEQTATEFVGAIVTGDTDLAKQMSGDFYLEQLRIIGKGVAADIDPENNVDIPPEFQPYTLGRLREINNAFSNTKIKELVDQLPEAYRDQALEAMLNPSEENTAKLNEKIAEFTVESTRGTSDVEVDFSNTEALPPLAEFDQGQEVIHNGEKVRIESKYEETINGTRYVTYRLSNKKTVGGGELSIDGEQEVVITDPSEKLRIVYNDQSLNDLADTLAEILASNSEVPIELIDEVVERTQNNPVFLARFNDEVVLRSNDIRLERAKKTILTPIEDIPYSPLVQQQLNKSASMFQAAVRTASEKYPPKEARAFIKRANEELGQLVKEGRTTEVFYKLNELGVESTSVFYNEVYQAARTSESAMFQHQQEARYYPSQVIAELEAEVDVPAGNEVLPTEDVEPDVQPKPDNGIDIVVQPNDSQQLEDIKLEAQQIAQDFFDQVGIDDLVLTPRQRELVMRYVAYEQGYDPTLEPVDFDSLPKQAQEFLNKFTPLAKELSNRIDEIKDVVGLSYEAMEGFYFPLKHQVKGEDTTTLIDLYESVLGFSQGRVGTFEGVIKDPAIQVRATVNEMSMVLAIANAKIKLTDLAKARAADIGTAIDKKASGEELNETDESALDIYISLKDIDRIAFDSGMNTAPEGQGLLYSLINLYQKDGNGVDLSAPDFTVVPDPNLRKWLKERGQTWADGIDPHFIVQTMDATGDAKATDEKGAKRYYGANARLWQTVINSARRAKQAEVKLQKEQLDVMAPFKTKKAKKDFNKKIAKLFFGADQQRRNLFRAESPEDLQAEYNLNEDEADAVFWYAKTLMNAQYEIAQGKQIRGNLANVSTEVRIRFSELQARVQTGIATEAEVNEYRSYAPTADESVERDITRDVARWIFEKQAIDSNDFFSYFESVAGVGIKGGYFYDLTNQIESWASYLESIGQENNARWWRMKIESNIKGNIFAFEDRLLDFIATKTKKLGEVVLGEQRTGSWIDVIRDEDTNRLKLLMTDAMTTLQKARINAFLLGNIGWSVTTQLSSLAFTIKQAGFSKTAKAIHGILFGDRMVTESEVVGLKAGGTGIAGLESVGEFSELSPLKTKRAMLRNQLGFVGSYMETLLTKVSYAAGYDYGIEVLGMNKDDARLHGDFVAATTQSMYDRITRNTALNSQFMRLFRPMQSYVFTAFSNSLDTLGVIGRKRSFQIRMAEAGRWILASRMWGIMWSMIFGDDLLKAIFNGQFNKGTVGSAIPLFGKQVDIKLSQMIPWKDDISWQGDSAPKQFSKATNRIIMAIANDEPNWERELAIYNLRYVTPAMGLGFSIPAQNLTKLISAKINGNAFEDIKGKQYEEFYYNRPTDWVSGMAFGIKAVDKRESAKGNNNK